jgi:hypothetical protein
VEERVVVAVLGSYDCVAIGTSPDRCDHCRPGPIADAIGKISGAIALARAKWSAT